MSAVLLPFILSGCHGRETVRIMTYNVGTFSKFEDSSMRMVSDMVREAGIDVVSMNELDSCTVRTGGVYQLERFASLMGDWQYMFGSAMAYDGGAYGDGLAAGKDAGLLDSWSVRLPQGDGAEPRALAVMEFRNFVVASTHLDHVSPDARMEQARMITEIMQSRYSGGDRPVFLCGDTNASPDSRVMEEFSRHWTILSPEAMTFPSDDPEICIDYIMAMKGAGDYEVVHSAVLDEFASGNVSVASDHLPVYVEVVI